MTGHGFSWSGAVRGAHATFFMALFALPMLIDCGGQATCDDVCDNVLDKCSTGEFSELARNDCLEQCAQRSNLVPEKCALEKDDVLSCLADADSLDCGDPQQSAACEMENAALNTCAFSSTNDGGDGGGGNGNPPGQSCEDDDECASGVCSWGNDTCIVPGELGDVCERDSECIDALCNWATDVCSEAGAAGAPCGRDDECISQSCPDDVCQ